MGEVPLKFTYIYINIYIYIYIYIYVLSVHAADYNGISRMTLKRMTHVPYRGTSLIRNCPAPLGPP